MTPSAPGITWVLVYRTEKYKRLKAEVEKQSKKRECLFVLLVLIIIISLVNRISLKCVLYWKRCVVLCADGWV